MAAEYGVIGEISRGSSTAADAHKRRVCRRAIRLSLFLSLSPSFPPSLSLPRFIFCHSTLTDAAFLFFPLSPPLLPFSLPPFFSLCSLVIHICKHNQVSHVLPWTAVTSE